MSPRALLDRRAAAPLGLLALVTAVFTVYLVRGTGFVLDDWYTLANAKFDGAWGAAGPAQELARPGAWVTYAFVFGLVGAHPAVVVVVLAALEAAAVVLLFVVLQRFVSRPLAAGAAALWVILPNHTSLEVWASASNIALSLVLVLLGLFLVTGARSPVRDAWALGAFGAAVLTYEACVPVVAVGVIALPWLQRGRPDRRLVVGTFAVLLAASGWILAHWHPDKEVADQFSDMTQVLPAHFGWGIAPRGTAAGVLLAAGTVGIAVAFVRVAFPTFRGGPRGREWAVLAGVVVVLVGSVPFVRYPYGPLGAGDRVNFLSAAGGALAWSGLVAMAAQWWRPVAVVGASALVAAGATTRLERVEVWHDAGRDAAAISAGVRQAIPDPDGVIFVGPRPIQRRNIAAFLDDSNLARALQLEYQDRAINAHLTYSPEEFAQAPPDLRFDLRTVSELEPDVVLAPSLTD